jgi:hypothetical protein
MLARYIARIAAMQPVMRAESSMRTQRSRSFYAMFLEETQNIFIQKALR